MSFDVSSELSLGLDEAKLRSGTAQIYAPGPGAPRRVAVVWIPLKECFEVRSLDTPKHNPDRVMRVRHCYDFSEVLTAFDEEARTALSLWAAKVLHRGK